MTDFLAELAALAEKATRIGWTADMSGNICRGMLPLFKKTGADYADTDLIVLLRNSLPAILALGRERDALLRLVARAQINGQQLPDKWHQDADALLAQREEKL